MNKSENHCLLKNEKEKSDKFKIEKSKQILDDDEDQ